MVTTARRRITQSKTSASRPRLRSQLQAETEALLRMEIGFIANKQFRAMERSRTREPNLPIDAVCALPAHVVRDMPAHLLRMCEVPLLTPEQEQDLFRWMNYYKYRANSLRTSLHVKRPSRVKLARIHAWLQRADQIRNHIVRSNTRLIISIVKKLADERNSFDDLLSEGIACLVRVVDKFDFARGFRFSTYATRAVQREVWRLVQRSHRDRNRYATGLAEQLESCPTEDLGDRIDELTWKRLTREIGRILEELDEREAFIVRQRFGLDDDGVKRTFQSLGEELGVCKERVRQLEIRAMKKLREMAVDADLDKLELDP